MKWLAKGAIAAWAAATPCRADRPHLRCCSALRIIRASLNATEADAAVAPAGCGHKRPLTRTEVERIVDDSIADSLVPSARRLRLAPSSSSSAPSSSLSGRLLSESTDCILRREQQILTFAADDRRHTWQTTGDGLVEPDLSSFLHDMRRDEYWVEEQGLGQPSVVPSEARLVAVEVLGPPAADAGWSFEQGDAPSASCGAGARITGAAVVAALEADRSWVVVLAPRQFHAAWSNWFATAWAAAAVDCRGGCQRMLLGRRNKNTPLDVDILEALRHATDSDDRALWDGCEPCSYAAAAAAPRRALEDAEDDESTAASSSSSDSEPVGSDTGSEAVVSDTGTGYVPIDPPNGNPTIPFVTVPDAAAALASSLWVTAAVAVATMATPWLI